MGRGRAECLRAGAAGETGELWQVRAPVPGMSEPSLGHLARRDLASELVPLHGACGHDRHPVGGRLQREDQTATEHLSGGCVWRREGAEGGERLLSGAGEGQPRGRSGTGTDPLWLVLTAHGGPSFPQNIHVCLGGLFVPEAYITATRQYVAQANSWSLEELCLEVNVTTSQSATLDACSFGVTGESGSRLGAGVAPGPCLRLREAVLQGRARCHRFGQPFPRVTGPDFSPQG